MNDKFHKLHKTYLRMVSLFLSTTPFCCGDLRTIIGWQIPWVAQNSLNFLRVNSPPRMNLKDLISKSFSFSTRALKFLKAKKKKNWLLPEKVHTCFSIEIINEGWEIFILTESWWVDWTTCISIVQIENVWLLLRQLLSKFFFLRRHTSQIDCRHPFHHLFFPRLLRAPKLKCPNLMWKHYVLSCMLTFKHFPSVFFKFMINIIFIDISTLTIKFSLSSLSHKYLYFRRISYLFSRSWYKLKILFFFFNLEHKKHHWSTYDFHLWKELKFYLFLQFELSTSLQNTHFHSHSH